MIKYFNKKLYLQFLLEIIYGAIAVAFVAIVVLIGNHKNTAYDMSHFMTSSESYNPIIDSLSLVILLGSFVLSFLALSFVWSKKRTDYIYSLPNTKAQLYFSKLLSVITMQFAILIFIAILGMILTFEYIGTLVFLSDLIITLIASLISSLVIIGAIFLAVTLTGRVLSSIILSAGIITLPALFTIAKVYRFDYHNTIADYFVINPDLYLPSNYILSTLGYFKEIRYVPAIVFSLLLGLTYIIFGYLLFKKRSGELSGVHTKNKLVHFITMGIVPFFIMYYMLITKNYELCIEYYETKIIISYFAFAFMLTFLYQLIVNRKIGKKNRCIWVYLSCAALALLMSIGAQQTLENKITNTVEIDDINSFSCINNGRSKEAYSYSYKISYGEYLTSSLDFTDNDIIEEMIYNINENFINSHTETCYVQLIKFNLKSGKEIYRNVPTYLEMESDDKLYISNIYKMLFEIPEYANNITAIIPEENLKNIYVSSEVNGNDDNLIEIYKTFEKEYNSLSLDARKSIKYENKLYKYEIIDDDRNQYQYFEEEIGLLYLKGRIGSTDVIDIYYITANTPDTANAYMEAINEVNLTKFKNLLINMYETPYTVGQFEIEAIFNEDENVKITSVDYTQIDYYCEKMLNIIKDNELITPNTNDIIVKLDYYDYTSQNRGMVYLKISQEELEQIKNLYDEIT